MGTWLSDRRKSFTARSLASSSDSIFKKVLYWRGGTMNLIFWRACSLGLLGNCGFLGQYSDEAVSESSPGTPVFSVHDRCKQCDRGNTFPLRCLPENFCRAWGGSPRMPERDLFGGAITLTIPDSYFDVSTIRQIPDHQEVWLEKDSDMSLIIELLDMPTSPKDLTAFSNFYFEELAADNSARQKDFLFRKSLPVPSGIQGDASASIEIGEGSQMIAKFNTSKYQTVHLWIAVVRLPRVKSDILVTWNDPEGRISESMMTDLVNSIHLKDWSLFATFN